jgi:hypothetical protein
MMTPEEKFIFDLDGYLVVKNALNADQLKELNDIADNRSAGNFNDVQEFRVEEVSKWGSPCLALVDLDTTLPYMLELLGPNVRLDHDYCLFMRKLDQQRHGLHGGPYGGTHLEADHWYRYHDGVIRNGLTVFTFCLAAAGPGDGGFTCIPGSHKSGFVPGIPPEVKGLQVDAHYISQPVLEAGDCLIFTEALIHGTRKWTAEHERRALLYKFSPGHSSWSPRYPDADSYPGISERQRQIMAPPSIGSRPAVS